MSDQPVSRRAMLGYAGAGFAAAGIPEAQARPVSAGPAASKRGVASLVAPLGPGKSLGRWRVEALLEPSGGAASVLLSDAEGRSFQLDICARDRSPLASRGPAQTEHFELFVANQGDGATGTREDHGLCAMALAEVIRGNEALVDRSGFSTLAERADPRRHVR